MYGNSTNATPSDWMQQDSSKDLNTEELRDEVSNSKQYYTSAYIINWKYLREFGRIRKLMSTCGVHKGLLVSARCTNCF